MTIILGKRSLSRLEGVNDDLRRVVACAANIAEPEEDFTVLEGVRSREQMMVNYGKGRTAAQLAVHKIPAQYARPGDAKVTWLNNPFMSNHRTQPGGGRAVDLAPYPIDWNDLGRFRRLAALMKRAAEIEGVAIQAGADWAKADFPHFELAGK